MKFTRRLVRHGNSLHVSLHPNMIQWLQWHAGQPLVIEATIDREVRIRLPRADDLEAPIQPMTLDLATPGSSR